MRLGPSLGIVYRVGAEGFSVELVMYRLGGAKPMQLQRGVRLGSRTTYAALWFWVQKSRLYKNSDLRYKWNNGTSYILTDNSEQVRLLRRGDIVQVYSNTALWANVSYRIRALPLIRQ